MIFQAGPILTVYSAKAHVLEDHIIWTLCVPLIFEHEIVIRFLLFQVNKLMLMLWFTI